MSEPKVANHLPDSAGFAPIQVRILATTDLHACLTAWDYYAHRPAACRGLSRVASLIKTAREQVPNTLLFDNGDFLSGSGLGDYIAEMDDPAQVHPMIAAMNLLNYDAANLGNHEFSHGLGFFRRVLKDATFPLVCSNFDFLNLPQIMPHALLPRDMRGEDGRMHRLKIGVLGLLPAQTLVWETAHLRGEAVSYPMAERAAATAQMLRAAGADVVIALAHTGLAPVVGRETEESLAQFIAQLPQIDAVIAGHSHQLYPAPGEAAPLPLVMPGFFGSHLGVLDLTLTRQGTAWQARRQGVQLRAISRRDPISGQLTALVQDAPEITALAAPIHSQITQRASLVIGQTDQRLHSYFATITSSAAMGLIAAAQVQALARMLPETPFEGLPILAAVAPFKAGGRGGPDNYTDLAIGPLRHHHAADLYMHPNRFVAFRVTGIELALWLERAASKYFQIAAGTQDAVLRNPEFPSFNCDSIFGLTYQIDLSQPPMFDAAGAVINPKTRRIQNLCYQGQPLQEGQVFALASNSFRREGKAGFAGTSQDHVIIDSPVLVQSLLRSYIAEGGEVAPPNLGHWRFAPQEGASVLFATSPKAREVIQDIAHFRPSELGLDTCGFLRFRLHL